MEIVYNFRTPSSTLITRSHPIYEMYPPLREQLKPMRVENIECVRKADWGDHPIEVYYKTPIGQLMQIKHSWRMRYYQLREKKTGRVYVDYASACTPEIEQAKSRRIKRLPTLYLWR